MATARRAEQGEAAQKIEAYRARMAANRAARATQPEPEFKAKLWASRRNLGQI